MNSLCSQSLNLQHDSVAGNQQASSVERARWWRAANIWGSQHCQRLQRKLERPSSAAEVQCCAPCLAPCCPPHCGPAAQKWGSPKSKSCFFLSAASQSYSEQHPNGNSYIQEPLATFPLTSVRSSSCCRSAHAPARTTKPARCFCWAHDKQAVPSPDPR